MKIESARVVSGSRALRTGSWALVLAALASVAIADGQLAVQKTVGTGIGTGDRFGTGVAMDGDWMAIGAGGNSSAVGAVHVYERVGTSWVERDTLVPAAAGSGDNFGQQVALKDDVIVGCAPTEPAFGAYVFRRSGTTWTEEALLEPNDWFLSDAASDAVAISDDVIAVGSRFNSNAAGTTAGAVYVFDRTGPTWATHDQTKLLPANLQSNNAFGSSVAVDGTRLIAGAPSASRAWVFERTGSGWVETAELAPSVPWFGSGVALDGDLAAVGSRSSVELLGFAGGSWSLLQNIDKSGVSADTGFGNELALENGRLVVGSFEGGSGGDRGTAWLFTEEGGAWIEREKIIPADAISGMNFGWSVATSGGDFVVCAPLDTDAGPNSGSAYLYRYDPPDPLVYCTGKVTSEGCVPSIGWTGTAALTGADDFRVLATNALPGKSGLFFWGTSGPAALPFLGGTLCVQPSLTRTVPQAAGGAGTCGGTYAFAFDTAYAASEGLAACTTVYGQWWMRDPQHPDGTGVALSDGLEVEVGP